MRFGIIGCGVIGPWHAKAITSAKNAELVAVCDILPEKAKKVADEYGISSIYTNYQEMLESDTIEAVSICTPSGMHAEMGIAAARCGKHVLSEKPIDITLEKIDLLIDECKKANVKLGCIFQRRTSPMWRMIRDAITSGCMGKTVLGDAYLKYYRSQHYYDSADWRGTWELDGGGALMNQGIHMIDLMRWIMGPIESVYALCDHLVRNIDVEDTACAVIKYKSGAFGVLEGTTSVNPGMNHRLEFHGEHGTILVDGEKIIKWDVPEITASCDVDGKGGVDVKIGTAHTPITSEATEGHRLQIEDFCEAIKMDREPSVSGEEARKAVEVVLAIYESARTGLPIKFQ
ncbi:MAG: Gfo/Idh/MocA family oxidoreductase [Armatimonadota bacterium]